MNILLLLDKIFFTKNLIQILKKNIFEGLNGIFACIHKSRGKWKPWVLSSTYSQIAYTIKEICEWFERCFISQSHKRLNKNEIK